MRQVVGGATTVAADNLIQYMSGVHTCLDESLRYCEGELRDARMAASRFGPPGPIQHLMGQVQSVWNRAGVRQNRINALEGEKTRRGNSATKWPLRKPLRSKRLAN